MIGNNLESTSLRRINVPLLDFSISGGSQGRFYFPELPALEKSTIVGIQVHLGNWDISVDSANTIQGKPIENIQRTSSLAYKLLLTIYNQNNEEVLLNFPIKQLFNLNSNRQFRRIFPFDFKIATKKSFLSYLGRRAVPSTHIDNLTLTFFIK